MVQVLYGTGKRSQMKYTMDGARNIYRLADVVLHEFERWILKKVINVFGPPSDQVVKANHLVPLFDQAIGKV